ncbi:ribose 5-phosphate isomerase B [Peptococcaceae bacterium]|nr:ribose 5-phosphate isomerase B [Peptococcaceae bacterium]
MKIIIGCDHAGYELKVRIISSLKEMGIDDIEDVGTHSTDSVDYPDQALAVAERVVELKDVCECEVRGILICGTGIGISIAANKVPGIRAANCHDKFTAQMAREHNDASVLAIGAKVVDPFLAEEIVRTFLKTKHAGGRHSRRVQKIVDIEKKYSK